MQLTNFITERAKRWPYWLVSLILALAAFGAYTCMYAYRKSFTAATFEGMHFMGIDYKVWLVIAQVLGYTCSKFYGIRFISAVSGNKRGISILVLIAVSWAALFLFAIVPAPLNIILLFLNGLPLGMIWGLVFGYLEGRRTTEFMAAIMSISLIFASGFVKTIARLLMKNWLVSEWWMPFITGLLFAVPLLILIGLLECMPAPTNEDKQLRSERQPMNAADRKHFLAKFSIGIIITLFIYILLTIARDLRDNFEVEIWNALGITNNYIYAYTDSAAAIAVLLLISLLPTIKQNFRAFAVIHFLIIAGCSIAGIATWNFHAGHIGPVTWMAFSGAGLYLAYIPYNAVFFERMLATFREKGNVGFVMYIADAAGYLGSISILLIKELGGAHNLSWLVLFDRTISWVALGGGLAAIVSLIYFTNKKHRRQKASGGIHALSV